MQALLEDLVRGIGWLLLKFITAGRYVSTGSGRVLFEGTIGLVVLTGVAWIAYRWFT